MNRSSTIYKWKQSKTILNKYVGWFSWDRTTVMDFSLKEELFWITVWYLGQKLRFDVKLMMDLFLTNMQLFTSQNVSCWTGVMPITSGLLGWLYQLFGSHSDGTHSLQDPLMSKGYNARFFQICYNEESHLHLGWPQGENIFIFRMNYSFKHLWIAIHMSLTVITKPCLVLETGVPAKKILYFVCSHWYSKQQVARNIRGLRYVFQQTIPCLKQRNFREECVQNTKQDTIVLLHMLLCGCQQYC